MFVKKSNIVEIIKMKLKVGQSAPTPSISSVLGPRGINPMKFLQEFNSSFQDKQSYEVIVNVQIHKDKTFKIVLKGRPSSQLIKEAINLPKGSSTPGKDQKGIITMDQLHKIAKLKIENIHSKNIDGVIRMLIGTARSIGVDVVDNV